MEKIKITEQELQDRKKRIIHAAFRMFCEKGIDGVKIQEIAQRAKVSEKSVYRYFGTKIKLVMETGFMVWSEIVSELMETIGEDYEQLTGIEQMQYLLYQFRYLYSYYSQYILFTYDFKLFLIRHSVKLEESKYYEELQPVFGKFQNAIQKGQKDGSITAQLDTEILYTAIWGFIRGYVVKMVIYDRMYNGTNIWLKCFDTACALILSGLQNFHNGFS